MQMPWPIDGEDLAGVFGRFAVADLRGVGVEEVGVPAELRHAGFERVAGAGRLVEEQQKRRLMRQQAASARRGDTSSSGRSPYPAAAQARRRYRSCVSM